MHVFKPQLYLFELYLFTLNETNDTKRYYWNYVSRNSRRRALYIYKHTQNIYLYYIFVSFRNIRRSNADTYRRLSRGSNLTNSDSILKKKRKLKKKQTLSTINVNSLD